MVFVAHEDVDALVATAREIVAIELSQSQRMSAGESLRQQLDFGAYLAAQAGDPSLTLRHYLADRGSAIET